MEKLSRRKFLSMSALVVGSGIVAACTSSTPAPVPTATSKPAAQPTAPAATATTKPAAPAPTNTTAPAAPAATATTKPAEPTKPAAAATNTAVPKPAATYKEAPMLAELVKAGKLPPVEQRLPEEPLVLEAVEKVGKYGGSWTFMEQNQTFNALNMVNWTENFMKYTRETSGYRPNLLTKWAWNADGTEITLFFRKGIKWSDGKPLTVNDWIWWWENMVLDENVKVARPVGSVVGGKDMKLTKVDDYTVKATFAAPNPLFLEQMCRGTGARATSYQVVPAHYLQQFHAKFNTSIKASEVNQLLDRFNGRPLYPDMPTYSPWMVKEAVQGQRCVLERNPYYWKVDTEGNQLPYMDGMQDRVAQTAELITLSCVAGEIDFQLREIGTKDIPLLKENETKGNYKVRMWTYGDTGMANIKILYCNKDKGIADLLWNIKFRQALSLAINRPRIADIVYLGLARPFGIVVLPNGAEFNSPRGQNVLKEWERLTSAYDVNRAKALLDEIGVVDKDRDGFRERPDGSKLELILDASISDKPAVENMQLVTEDWNAIGLKTVLNTLDATVWNNRATACESMLRQRGGSSGGLIIAPAEWAPIDYNEYCVGGPPYGQYYVTGGKQGLQPPPGSFLEKLVKIYDDAVTIVDEAKRNDRILDAYQVHIDEWPITIGTVGDMQTPVVVKNTLHNVPAQGMVASWTWGWPGTGDPEQWWKD